MNSLFEYIESISINDKKDIYIGLLNLLNYLKSNNITLSDDDAELLILNSNKVYEMLKYVKNNYSLNKEDNNLKVLISTYNLLYEKEISEDVKYLKGTNDIDTVDLYIRNMPKLLTPDEEEKVMQEILSGNDSSREKLVEHNLRLVVYVAKKYVKPGTSLMDLVQDGNIALINSAKHYDPSLGYKFSTYAVNSIRQSIIRNFYVSSRAIKLPSFVNELVMKMYKMENILTNKLGRKPSDEELACALDINIDKLKKIEGYASYTMSLDSPVNCDDDLLFLKDIIESDTESMEETIIHKQYLEDFRKIVFENKKLSDKEKKVISLRYGFYDGTAKSLKDISTIMNMTREGVRVVEKKALGKILMDKRMRKFYFTNGNTSDYTPKMGHNSYNRVLKN